MTICLLRGMLFSAVAARVAAHRVVDQVHAASVRDLGDPGARAAMYYFVQSRNVLDGTLGR